MKKSLLLWTLLTPLVIASEIKEDLSSVPSTVKKTAVEDIKDWKVQGNFNHTFCMSGALLNRQLEIEPLFINSRIEEISLLGYKNGNYGLVINTKEEIDCPVGFKKEFRNLSKRFATEKIEKFPEFLNFFYQNQYLPDCIIDFILKKMADRKVFIEDFRLTPVKIISELNQALTERSSEEDFQILLTQKLEKVKDSARRQNLIAEVVINLQKDNTSSPLIKKLIQEITDPTATSLYAEIKLIQSDIEMNDFVTQPDSCVRYRQALQTILDIPLNVVKPEVQKQINAQINILVKNIYNNDQPSYDSLPLALQGLKLDSHSILNMLMHISQLTQENKKLQQQITKESAIDRSN